MSVVFLRARGKTQNTDNGWSQAITHGAFIESPVPDIHTRYATVEHARHPDALKLLAFWDARPADGIVMGRDVPSRAIASLLRNISILEPTEDRSDLRIRLAGASLLKRWNGDVKGRNCRNCFLSANSATIRRTIFPRSTTTSR